MRKNSLSVMVGFPRSGKSTFCKVHLTPKGYVVVSPDTIRYALHGNQFIGIAEPFVWATAQTMVRTLLLEGYDVVVDATNTTKERRKMWVNMAKEQNCNLWIYWVKTDAETCHSRNDKVDSEVITRMANQFVPPTEEEGVVIEVI